MNGFEACVLHAMPLCPHHLALRLGTRFTDFVVLIDLVLI